MRIFLILITGVLIQSATAQNIFQELYTPLNGAAHCFGSYQLTDGGYIFTGIVSKTTDKVYMTRTDCEGHVLWSKSYNNSSTIGNISQRVIPLKHGGFCLAASIGSFNAYNILVVKTDDNGNTIWQKIMQGSGDDVVNSVIETRGGDLVIAGHTNSFGQDASSPYNDVYIAKIDSGGNYLWGKAIGTKDNIDQAFDICESPDSGYVATGRYIEQGTFYSFLMKLDANGQVQFIKAYGDTNQYSCGYGLIACSAGGFAITGSSTIMKQNFQSYGDEFLIRTDALGDTAWTRTYHGTNPDQSENASSIIELSNGFIMAVATMSYPTVGFVPNKHVILKTDLQGNMNFVNSYNNGGSHYPYITKPVDGVGILLSGFTTNYSTTTFKPLIIRTDNSFYSGCNQTDLLSQTVMDHPSFQVRTPAYVVASGGSLVNSTVSANEVWADSTICAFITDSCTIVNTTVNEQAPGSSQTAVYNPTTHIISLQGFVERIESAALYDATGRLVKQQSFSAELYIPGSLTQGLYLLQVKTKFSAFTFKLLTGY